MNRIPRVLVKDLNQNQKEVSLPKEEAHHLVQVLRISSGQKVFVVDGKMNEALGTAQVQKKDVLVTNLNFSKTSLQKIFENSMSLHVVVAVVKLEALSTMIEKVTELGADTVQLLFTEHVSVKRDNAARWVEKLQKISDQSLKQCERIRRTKVFAPLSLEEWLEREKRQKDSSQIFWLSEHQKSKDKSSLFLDNFSIPTKILVGPEGGFSENEVSLLRKESKILKEVSLGETILRADTAAIVGLGLLREQWIVKGQTQT